MAPYILGWVEIAIEQYLALPARQQHLIDQRINQMLDQPNGRDCDYDRVSDQWTTADDGGEVLITYTFRLGRPRLIILRLVY